MRAGGEAVFNALEALDIPGEFTVGIQTSPWRMYDGDDRIITVHEMAAVIRKQRTEKHLRVRLVGSWTAALPEGGRHAQHSACRPRSKGSRSTAATASCG